MDLYMENESGAELAKELTDKLGEVVRLGLRRAGKTEDFEIGLTFVTREEIRRLNREYRSVDSVTDVLSFTYGEEWRKENMPVILGDIVICVERAQSQAKEYGHSLERELAFLTAHGMMHLLGYDHENEADEQKMINEQEAVLSALGITR